MFTLQGGNFQSGGVPVANGSVVLTLSNSSATVRATGAAATAQYIINLDSLGNLPLTQVWGNAELSPDGTFYTAQLFSGANGTGSNLSTATWIIGPSAPYSGTLFPNVLVLPPVSFVGAVVFPGTTVSFSATPNFNAASFSTFKMTLTGNVTSSTLTGAATDQLIVFEITQDGIGSHTFAWPANVQNPPTIKSAAGAKTVVAFIFDGSNAWPLEDGAYARLDGSNMPFTGQVIGKNGTVGSPSFGFASETNTGVFRQAANVIGLAIAGVLKSLWNTAGALFGSGQAVSWSSNADPSAAVADTGLSRTAAATIAVGNGAAGNGSGTFEARKLQLDGSTSGNTVVQSAATASGTLTLPAATGTLARTAGDTFATTTLTSPTVNGTPTGTGIATVTLKRGSGAGNYTGTNTTYSNVDGTNLSYTVTIPTGWKLVINAAGTIFVSTAAASVFAALADGGTVFIESGVTPAGITAPQFWGFNWVINGDGASHTITLQAKTAAGADAWNIGNANATSVPQMVLTLVPSN